jgi:hypothetical protein
MSENLESEFFGIVVITQTLLQKELRDKPMTVELIRKTVEDVISKHYPDSSVDKAKIEEELIRRFSTWIASPSVLSDSSDHVEWLTADRKKGWRYWQRYREYLEKDKIPLYAVDGINDATNRVLGLLEDPEREGPWDRRGLVVGHVQSGKTANYTGLICKAADAGYKIIIVLAGVHNNLRAQTQIRLEEGFLGFDTSKGNVPNKYIGVGAGARDAHLCPNCATNRSERGDFTTAIANHLAIHPEERPWLFVIKKNKTVLDRLLKWVNEHVADKQDPDGRRVVSKFPLLLIDDEADHASIDTGDQGIDGDGNPQNEYEPKAINRRIRKLLHHFEKKAYVGYTATPFANIFIDRRNTTEAEGPDLFPKSFIVNLPAPSNYIGPVRVFGTPGQREENPGLPLIREFGGTVNAPELKWMPVGHDKHHVPKFERSQKVPPSLREAISAFVLCCAVRKLRGQGTKHCSMLIHVTRFTAVQEKVREQVTTLLNNFYARIRGFSEQEKASLLEEWRTLWKRDFVPTTNKIRSQVEKEAANAATDEISSKLREEACSYNLPPWKEVVGVLHDVLEDLADVGVKTINGTAGDVLDYAAREEVGLKVIAVGGDKLARGLTLEGLCISYFVRSTRMYDTLMQMGRWFGYRNKYLDLCRLYTTPEVVEWFEHITDAAEELRRDFEWMAQIRETPEHYGMRVQSHPVLMVTSALKMRSAGTVQVSFSGQSTETVSLHREEPIIAQNLSAMEKLLEDAGDPVEGGGSFTLKRGEKSNVWNGFRWNNVPANSVIAFLETYKTHPAAQKVNSKLLADFIRKKQQEGELVNWTVALVGAGQDGGSSAGWTFCNKYRIGRLVERNQEDKTKGAHYSIGRLISPRDESIDLDEAEWNEALRLTLDDWEANPERTVKGIRVMKKRPEAPGGIWIRHVRGGGDGSRVPPHRDRGLLLLYPIDPHGAGLPAGSAPVVGFGISFPVSKSLTTVQYKVDHLLWEELNGPEE